MPREWDSSAYHRLSAPQVSWGKKVLSRLSLRGDELLLDAGCGTGRLTADLLQLLPRGRVVAADISLNMLQRAREHLLPEFGTRVTFAALDLQQGLPFHRVFDGIVSTASFHWVLDHDALFRNLHDVLKPGGWIEAQCGGGPNLARLRKRVAALSAQAQYASFLQDYREPWLYSDADTAAVRMLRTGFVGVETSLEEAPLQLDDASHFRDFVASVILHRHLERLPDHALRERFLKVLTEMAASDNPPFLLDYWRLNLRGRVE
jgi:trans-aconitate methyltransferase